MHYKISPPQLIAITHAVVMSPSLCTRHFIMRLRDPALSRGRRGWGVASRSTVHMTWQTSWIIHGRRVTKVVWETRVGLASPSSHSYLFPQIPRRRKKEMEKSQCKHVTCHMYCVTAAWRTDKTWPMTWAMLKGSEDKNCELLDQYTLLYSSSGVLLRKWKPVTLLSKILHCTWIYLNSEQDKRRANSFSYK